MKRLSVKVLILFALLALWGFFLLTPVVNTLIRYGTLLSFTLVWAWVLWSVWELPKARYGFFGVSAALLLLLGLGGGKTEAGELREAYVGALKNYEGSPYVWGGENRLGIDCSGLARAAMIDAHLWLGLTRLNPAAFRQALFIWFYDAGADTLAAGFRGQTRELLSTPTINQLPHEQLLAGDMMVDSHGVHAMIYLGEQVWIEADPNAKRVIRVTVPTTNHWFNIPARIVRWRALDQDE